MKKEFVKITFQDLEIAEAFFENNRHFSEFILAVISYYRGKNFDIKTKIVSKYFETYKKTMDFIIESKKYGLNGAVQKIENQTIKNDTLEGGLQAPLEPSLQANNKLLISNNKEEIINNKYSFLDFWILYGNKKQKEKTEKKYKTLSLHEKEKIFSTLPHFLLGIKDKQFQPYPLTYLNQKRWEDELPEIKKQTEIKQTENNEW